MSNSIHLNALATTIISNVGGNLKRVVINTKGVTGNTLSLYDNNSAASGKLLAVIDTTSNVGFLEFRCSLNSGLVAVLATGTAADITVVWD